LLSADVRRIAAEAIYEHLRRSGFVVFKRALGPGLEERR
jgi:hypothetical protein